MSALARHLYCNCLGNYHDIKRARDMYQAAGDAPGLVHISRDYRRRHGRVCSANGSRHGRGNGEEGARQVLQDGIGVESDAVEAASLYNTALSDRDAMTLLGVCYLRGEGVERDWAKGVELIRNASDRERAIDFCTVHLGWCYLRGLGVEKDVKKAVSIFQSASNHVYPATKGLAQAFLGHCYERGEGVDLDIVKAQVLYREAAKHYKEGFGRGANCGDTTSLFNLGICLKDGHYVERDLPGALLYLERDACFGHKGAAKALAELRDSALLPTTLGKRWLKRGKNGFHLCYLDLKTFLINATAYLVQENITREQLQCENIRLKACIKDRDEWINQEKDITTSLKRELKEEEEKSRRYQCIIGTMTSLISADVADFRVNQLLGTGSNSAAFKVLHHSIVLSGLSQGEETTTTSMVMKVVFNWENTPRQTLLRQKYLAECVTLSLVPHHPNIIHPLGAIILPRYF
ncbi:sel1 repeat family protein [Pelomyxa schiedti]|nr:sel1 repeat family protein [Pelomyxa schiedti]